MAVGRSLELFFVDGRPDGLMTASVFNWTGHLLKAPRTQINEALKRPEAGNTGVYLLLGQKDGRPFAYVGEGEVMKSRIKEHDLKKDWWDEVIFISTSSNELNKAHVKYLECELIKLAQAARAYTLDNGNMPGETKLSEAGVANMQEFLATLRLVLPAIGVPLLIDNTAPPPVLEGQAIKETSPFFELTGNKHGLRAKAMLAAGNFVVFRNSDARLQWQGLEKVPHSYRLLHEKLVSDGVIDISGTVGRFATDYTFSSPSAAAAVILGRPASGLQEWTVEGTNATYGEWEKAKVQGT